jgi:general secretion pathway protein I
MSAGRRGFTLLEVMVSLGILAIALTAIAGINAANYASSEYARNLTIATLLARSKMIDVEEEMWEDGSFPSDDKTLDGSFEKEGYPKMRWKASVRKIDVDVGQLIGGLLGGDASPEALEGHVKDLIGGLSGAGDGSDLPPGVADQVGGSDLANLLKGDQLEVIFKQVGDNLSEAIREIELEIEWGTKGRDLESVSFVQYIVTTGRINTPSAAGIRLPASVTGTPLPGHRNTRTVAAPPPGTLPGKEAAKP